MIVLRAELRSGMVLRVRSDEAKKGRLDVADT
jgi:hypothetical protein